MKILLTGASGHLGYATVRECEAAGHEVVALVRAGSSRRALEGTRATVATGDVLDPASVTAAARGCDAIIHHAAVFSLDNTNPDDILRPAVEGTRNILAAARQAGIPRVVYTSSVVAMGMSGSPDKVLDGSTWNRSTGLPYVEAKTRGEQLAHEIARDLGLELMVLCPTGITGPGDYRLTPSQGNLLAMLTGRAVQRQGGTNIVWVFDVARLHVQALTQGVPFKRYVAGSRDNFTYGQIYELLQEIVGKPLPPLAQDSAGRPVYAWYDIRETCADFDYDPLPARETLRSAVDWFRRLGQYQG